jgi:prolipoprotein diacylglyceryltransferase
MLLDRRHPTQIYLLLASLGTYQVLKAQERQDAMAGVLFYLWLLLFSLARVAVEFFVESPAIFGPFTLAQIVNVAAAVVALIGLVVLARKAPAAELKVEG